MNRRVLIVTSLCRRENGPRADEQVELPVGAEERIVDEADLVALLIREGERDATAGIHAATEIPPRLVEGDVAVRSMSCVT